MAYKQFYDVDYTSTKTRIKTYLSQQTILKDYNFEGSAISFWLNLVAYIIVYLNSIMNFFSNEMFIQNAQLEENIFKSAFSLNYLPKRKSAAKINLTAKNNMLGSILIPKETAILIGNVIVSTIEDYTIAGNQTQTITCYEGEWVTFNHTYSGLDFESIRLADKENIDHVLFALYVNGEKWNSIYDNLNYYQAKNYFIRYLDNFDINFDKKNGIFSIPEANDAIVIKYLKTNGALYNGLSINTNAIIKEAFEYSEFLEITVNDHLKDGTDEESLGAIAENAPLFYSSAGRCVTEADYNYTLRSLPLYTNMADMIVYSSHKDIVDFDENPVESLTTESKIDKGFFVFTGIRRSIDANENRIHTFMTLEEKNETINFFESYRFMQVFGKYRKPNILQIQPLITVKVTRDFDVDKQIFNEAIKSFLESKIGFNSSFNKSELISFIKAFNYVVYCDIDFNAIIKFGKPLTALTLENVSGFSVGETVTCGTATGLIIEIKADKNILIIDRTSTTQFEVADDVTNGTTTSEVTKIFNKTIIRLFNKLSIPTSRVGDEADIEDLLYDGVTFGNIEDYANMNSGYIAFDDVFTFDGFDSVELTVAFNNTLNINLERETFLDFKKSIVTYI